MFQLTDLTTMDRLVLRQWKDTNGSVPRSEAMRTKLYQSKEWLELIKD
jgi:hypothetical protein